MLEAGIHTNYTVAFIEGYQHPPGSTILPGLYLDHPEDQEFTLTFGGTEDFPESFGFYPETGLGRFVGNSSSKVGFNMQ